MGDDTLSVLKGTLDLLILKCLRGDEERHGFEVLDWIHVKSENEIQIEEGALYPALHRLEKRGLLSSQWGVSEKGRRAKYYRITPAGVEACTRQEAEWARYVQAVGRLGIQGQA